MGNIIDEKLEQYSEGPHRLTPAELLSSLEDGDITKEGLQAKLYEVVTLEPFDDFILRATGEGEAEAHIEELVKYVNTLIAYEQGFATPQRTREHSNIYFPINENTLPSEVRFTEERKHLALHLKEALDSIDVADLPEFPKPFGTPSKLGAEAQAFSLGIHMPDVINALEKSDLLPEKEGGRHLLIGALSLETIDTFRRIFPKSNLTCIDPQGEMTRLRAQRQGMDFRLENILDADLEDLRGQCDSIIADAVFSSFVSEDGRVVGFDRQATLLALKKMKELLRPDTGRLIFTERQKLGMYLGKEQAVWQEFHRLLGEAGFEVDEELTKRRPKKVRFRHDLYKYIGGKAEPDDLEIKESLDVFLFVAKPSDVVVLTSGEDFLEED